MSHTTSLRRTASAVGATALLGVLLAAPATAGQDPGTGGPTVGSSTSSQVPTGVDRNRQLGGFTYSGEVSTLPQTATKPQAVPIVVFRDNDAIEYLQVGAGVLAGIVIAGAGAVIVSRRHHGGLTPA